MPGGLLSLYVISWKKKRNHFYSLNTTFRSEQSWRMERSTGSESMVQHEKQKIEHLIISSAPVSNQEDNSLGLDPNN